MEYPAQPSNKLDAHYDHVDGAGEYGYSSEVDKHQNIEEGFVPVVGDGRQQQTNNRGGRRSADSDDSPQYPSTPYRRASPLTPARHFEDENEPIPGVPPAPGYAFSTYEDDQVIAGVPPPAMEDFDTNNQSYPPKKNHERSPSYMPGATHNPKPAYINTDDDDGVIHGVPPPDMPNAGNDEHGKQDYDEHHHQSNPIPNQRPGPGPRRPPPTHQRPRGPGPRPGPLSPRQPTPDGGPGHYRPSSPTMAQGNPWSTDIFGCMEDPNNCLTTFLLPCVTFGQNAEILDEGRTPCMTAGMNYVKLGLFLVPCLYSYGYRTKLRMKYGLQEFPYSDCLTHALCHPCALAQEFRELSRQGHNPALGWSAYDSNSPSSQGLSGNGKQPGRTPPMPRPHPAGRMPPRNNPPMDMNRPAGPPSNRPMGAPRPPTMNR